MINYVFCQQLVVTLAHFLWQASLVGAIAYGLNPYVQASRANVSLRRTHGRFV